MNLVELDHALRKLRLSGIADVLEVRLRQAQTDHLAPLDLVSALVADELERRQDRLFARRHKQAGFRDPDRALDSFDFDFNKKMNRALLYDLATARFIERHEDALFLGPPGTGKSHLAQAIGRAAIQQGYRVVYREAHTLIEEIADATLDGTRKTYLADLAAALVGVGLATPAQAAAPVVKVVPWVAANPLVPHDTYQGKTITLKGTTDATATQYYRDYGDGSAPQAWTAVGDRYALEATHAYTSSATFPLGTVFTARLYVKNAGGETAYQNYFVKLQAKTLAVEVNVAIDEGLWYLHKSQTRTVSSGMDVGDWNGGYVGSGHYSVSAANTNAFEVNGHLESGSPDNPYTETVARGLRYVFLTLTQGAITSRTNPLGTFNPDGNGNGTARYVNQSYPFYQGGMLVDAIVASGTPTAIVQGGPLVGRTYLSVVQDMVDGYAYCQYTGGTVSPAYGGGGWRYNCGDWPDNSPSQWGAIAIIPAVREFSVVLNPIVPQWNKTWLKYSWDGHGFGYTGPGYYPWGPYAVTPSGMVQMVMDGIGRGDPMWDQTESWMRDNFGLPVAESPVRSRVTTTACSRCYVNGGLLPPVLLPSRAGAQPVRLQPTAPAVGLFEQWSGACAEIEVGPGDVLALFSDGVTEAMCGEAEFGEARFLEELAACRQQSAAGIVETILASVQAFSGGSQYDDLTLVVARGVR